MPIDVAAIGCDMLSATGRKYLRGPRGTGFLYVRRAVLDRIEPPFLDLQAARIETLATELRRRLAEIPGVSVRDRGRRICGIITFTVECKPARDIVAALRRQRINCHRSSPRSLPSDARAPRLADFVRASVHYYNTDEEVARFAAAVAALA